MYCWLERCPGCRERERERDLFNLAEVKNSADVQHLNLEWNWATAHMQTGFRFFAKLQDLQKLLYMPRHYDLILSLSLSLQALIKP